jgi:hypothetical protein
VDGLSGAIRERIIERGMNFINATARYEEWLDTQLRLIHADLERKHEAMKQDVFSFLRATFYRWMQLWPEVCSGCAAAPKVLAVGDLHVENFGTWRDVEGRLVWGINDFDEAFELPYTIDLVRLGASAHMAIKGAHLRIGTKDACDAVLAGYEKGINAGGTPFVLEENHPWLRAMVSGVLRDPQRFWAKMDALPTYSNLPATARKAIEKMLPASGLRYRTAHRVAGLGSLGRERYVAVAECHGAKIAREAKPLAPSACVWAKGSKSNGLHYQEILDAAVRCPDPFVRMKGRWIVRRLAPDCSRVELASMPKERDENRLLYSMGFETANVHLGTRNAAKMIRKDLRKRSPQWLHRAAADMVKATIKDWEYWRDHWRAKKPSPG